MKNKLCFSPQNLSDDDSTTAPPAIQEYSIRVPKQGKKKHHVMRFNSVLNIDFTKWSQVKLERENNQKEFKGPEDDQPKYGAGSEFGRDAKEEARRKKFGIVSRRYRPEDQPWILKSGGKTGKKFKGIREGGVGENAAYYVFTHAADGAIEAFPLCEWYNFQPIQRYKPLSAEEAEQEFGRRNKVMNYFSLMLRKRLKGEDDADLDDGEEGKGKKVGKRKSKELKISDMDDWMISGDDDSSSGEEKTEQQMEEKTKTKRNDLANKKKERKKKKGGSDDSAMEESDDGDEEGRELDYISDSSDSESDVEAKAVKEMKGVSEESALRRLLTSDEEEEDEEKKEEKKKSDSEEQPEKVEGKAEKDKPSPLKKKKKKKPKNKPLSEKKADAPPPKVDKNDDSSSNFSPDSSDSEVEGKAKLNSAGSSRCGSPTAGPSDSEKKSQRPPSKRPRLDPVSSPLLLGESGITEEAVRRYLMRKPMTTTELLQKFKSRKTGLNSEQLVNVMTQILKRINPVKQTIKNKMYLSIKA